MSKFMSRKFWIAVSALGAAIVGAASGQIPWSEALPSMAAIVIGYCAAPVSYTHLTLPPIYSV